jgi:hypothetical protein
MSGLTLFAGSSTSPRQTRAWQASTGWSAGTCDWPYTTTFDTDHRIELFG